MGSSAELLFCPTANRIKIADEPCQIAAKPPTVENLTRVAHRRPDEYFSTPMPSQPKPNETTLNDANIYALAFVTLGRVTTPPPNGTYYLQRAQRHNGNNLENHLEVFILLRELPNSKVEVLFSFEILNVETEPTVIIGHQGRRVIAVLPEDLMSKIASAREAQAQRLNANPLQTFHRAYTSVMEYAKTAPEANPGFVRTLRSRLAATYDLGLKLDLFRNQPAILKSQLRDILDLGLKRAYFFHIKQAAVAIEAAIPAVSRSSLKQADTLATTHGFIVPFTERNDLLATAYLNGIEVLLKRTHGATFSKPDQTVALEYVLQLKDLGATLSYPLEQQIRSKIDDKLPTAQDLKDAFKK